MLLYLVDAITSLYFHYCKATDEFDMNWNVLVVCWFDQFQFLFLIFSFILNKAF